MNLKLKTPVGKYKVTMPIKNGILITAKNQYDINMLFARYQEFYESDNKNVRYKHITFPELMRQYRKQWKKDVFTYPVDWAGFNLPDVAIERCLSGLKDMNQYDEIMSKIHGLMYNENGEKFYVIGVVKGADSTLDHEIAHGLYYLDSAYRDKVDYLTNNVLPEKIRTKIIDQLKEWGYAEEVYIDEVQALLSEPKPLEDIAKIKHLNKYRKMYRKIFKMHKKLNLIKTKK